MPEIKIKVRGLEEVKSFIDALPRNLRGLATKAIAEYLKGDDLHGLKHEPPYKQLYRRNVYKDVYFMAKDGHKVYGFSSLAQLRKVSMIVKEKPPGESHRTHAYRDNWKILYTGVKVVITGMLPHDKWVDRFSSKVGWREPMDIIASNTKGAIRHANAEVNKWLKARNRK